jgi:hypothetical protein
MLTLRFGVPVVAEVVFLVVAGLVFLVGALFLWVRGRGRRSLAYWCFLVAYVAFALFAEFAFVANLTPPRTFHLWSNLELAALCLAGCAELVAVVNLVRDVREAQHSSGLPR